MAFETIIKAARQFENSNWLLADELLKHADGVMGGPRGINAVAAALADEGLDYTAIWLRELRNAAETFSPERRHRGIGVKIHIAAGNPDMLDAIIKLAKRENKPLSLHGVERIMTQLAREERAEREEEAREAEAEAKKAEKREAEAKNESARKKAEKEKTEAKKRAQKARGAPKRKRATKPPKEDQSAFLLVRVQFAADVKQIAKLIKRMDKTLKPALDQLTPSFCNNAVEELLECANEMRRLSDLIEKNRPSGTKRGHLYAV